MGLQIYVWYKNIMSDKLPTISKTSTRYSVLVSQWISIQPGSQLSLIKRHKNPGSLSFLLSTWRPEAEHVMQTATWDMTISVAVLGACGSYQGNVMPIYCLHLCTLSWAKWVDWGQQTMQQPRLPREMRQIVVGHFCSRLYTTDVSMDTLFWNV